MIRAALPLVVGLLLAGTAHAQPAATGGPRQMSEPELAAQRAGIRTPGGLDIGFGATVSTYVDGQLALETRLTWTDQGPVTEQSGKLGANAVPGGAFTTIPGLTGGVTQVLHDLDNRRIASVVVNTASDRTIRQDTDITLTVPQLADLQRQVAVNATAANLQSAVGAGLRDRPGR